MKQILDWLFPSRLDPLRTCLHCERRREKKDMLHTIEGWFCNREHCDANFRETWLRPTKW